MEESNDFRRGRSCVSDLHVHLVFVTKYRRRVFEKEHLDAMAKHFTDVCTDMNMKLVEFNGETDHVHLLVEYPPVLSISKIVNALKGVSSRLLRRDFPALHRRSLNTHLWSPSYFAASCGGVTIETLKKYIEQQDAPKR